MLQTGKYFLRRSLKSISNKRLLPLSTLQYAFSTTKKKNSYYNILNVSTTATVDEIKEAYRDLAKAYHPDTGHETSKDQEKFVEINEAYEVLSDPKLRSKYDFQHGINSGPLNAEVNIEFENNDNYEQLQKKRTSNKESNIDDEVRSFFEGNYFNQKEARKAAENVANLKSGDITKESLEEKNTGENFIPYSLLFKQKRNENLGSWYFTLMYEFRLPILAGMIGYMGYLTVYLYYKKNKNKEGVTKFEKVKEGRGHYGKLLPLNIV